MKRSNLFVVILGVGLLAAATVGAKGKKLSSKQMMGLQKAPLDKLGVVLDGFHLRDGHPDEQMEAIHYCSKVDDDLTQCVLYDSVEPTARMIGIEYVMTEKALKNLPADEQVLWHSHVFEVTSGMLHAPGMTAREEKALMKQLAGTYGKTWHTWQTHRTSVPMGRPELMMAFTKDGQARADLTEDRDRRFGIKTADLAKQRANLTMPTVMAGVDIGEQGLSCQPQTKSERQKVRGREDQK